MPRLLRTRLAIARGISRPLAIAATSMLVGITCVLAGCGAAPSFGGSLSLSLVGLWLVIASAVGLLAGCGTGSDSLGRGASIDPLLSTGSAPVSTPSTPTPALPAAKVVFGSQPGGAKNDNPAVQAGRALPTFTAIVVDVNGNRVAGATNAVTVALAPPTPGNVTLQGTLTVNAVDGVATFSDVHVLPAGSGFVLSASASGLAPDSSQTFGVNPLVNVLASVRRDFAQGLGALSSAWVSEGTDDVASGHFTSSGHVDLVVTNSSNNSVSVMLGNGDGSFTTVSTLPTGTRPNRVVVTDINEDGKTDIVVGHEWQSSLGIMLGNGNGTFAPMTTLPTWVLPTRIVAADLGTGHVSLIVANRAGQTAGPPASVLLLRGNGDGTFAAPQPILPGTMPGSQRRDIAVGSFTQSGKPDVVVVQDGLITLLTGNGDGTFLAPVNIPKTGLQPLSVAAAAPRTTDPLSILITDGATNNLAVLTGNGDGTFNAAVNFPIPSTQGITMGVGDLNGDGIKDVVVPSTPNGTQGVVSVLLGQSNGQFSAAQNIATSGAGAKSAIVGEFNEDGQLDFATLSGRVVTMTGTSHPRIGGVVSAFLNQGGGVFPAPAAVNGFTQTQAQISVDLDGDGFPEIVTTDVTANDVKVLRGTTAGTFSVSVVAKNLTGAPDGLKAGDFNSDGHPDLAIALSNSPAVAVLLGNGDGSFNAPVNVATASKADNLVIGDFNGDSKSDIVTANQTGLTGGNVSYTLLRGNGDGTFQAATNFGLGKPWNLAAADFNGDGKLDIASVFITGSYTNVSVDITGRTPFPASLSVTLGNGDGTFQAATNYNVASQPFALAAGDLDRDAKIDLVVPGAFSSQIDILKGNGDGTFKAPTTLVSGFGPNAIELVDVNFDGNLDIVTANRESSSVTILYGNGDGTFPTARSQGGTANFRSVSVGDFNRDGLPDISAGGGTTLNVFLGQ